MNDEKEKVVEEEVVEVIDGEVIVKKQQFVEVDPALCHYAYAQEVIGIFDDGGEFSFQSYDSIPKGHKLADEMVKRCVVTANLQLAKYRKESGKTGDFVFDRFGLLAYNPNTVARLQHNDIIPVDGKLVLVDVTKGLELSKNQTFSFEDKTYVVYRDMDLTKSFGVKFVYGLETVKVDVE